MKTSFFPLLLLSAIILFSCQDDATTPGEEPLQAIKTERGTPLGERISKVIGPEGGSLQMPDGSVRLQIPAGAVAAATEFSLQAVENTFPDDRAASFRLLPEGMVFDKPVTLTYSYEGIDLTGTAAELLYLTYQDAEGYYYLAKNTFLDKSAKTLTVETTHFSDWTCFANISLRADKEYLQTNDFTDLQVQYFMPLALPTASEDSQLGMWTDIADTKLSYSWSLAFGAGQLQPQEPGVATFHAPASVPSENPVGVSVRIRNAELIVHAHDPERANFSTTELILLSTLYIQAEQFVTYTLDGVEHIIFGDCVDTGCFYLETNGRFYLKISMSGNRYMEITIPGASGAGTYGYGEGAGKAEIEVGTGLDNEYKRYITWYQPCYQCSIAYSEGSVKINNWGSAANDYTLEGEYAATVYYWSGMVNPPSKVVSGTFKLKRR